MCQNISYGMINKNPETDSRVQPKGQKNETASYWLLPLLQSEMAVLPLRISE